MISPISIEPAEDVAVLYVRYSNGAVRRTVAVDADAEILADIANDDSVIGIECLSMEATSRASLVTFARDHELTLPAEIDTFALSDLP
jgi:uncharacterized protein YuzE